MQQAITEVIEEAIYRRVKATVDQYVKKNGPALAENKIAGVEWNLGLTVLVDNLGLNSTIKPRTTPFLQRLLNTIKNFLNRATTPR